MNECLTNFSREKKNDTFDYRYFTDRARKCYFNQKLHFKICSGVVQEGVKALFCELK